MRKDNAWERRGGGCGAVWDLVGQVVDGGRKRKARKCKGAMSNLLTFLRVTGALLALANAGVAVWSVMLHYKRTERGQDAYCELVHPVRELPTCQLHPSTQKRHALSTGTVAVLSFWQILLAPFLTWGFARNPSHAQGALAWARSRLGRASILAVLGSFTMTLGWDDRDVQDALVIVGGIDLAFAFLNVASYICVSSGGPFQPSDSRRVGRDALNDGGGGSLENPFGELQGGD